VLAGRYRLQNVIGSGGMGIVWLAADELLSRDVAVKETIRPPDLDEAHWALLCERSLREARTAARLSHPNIVGVYDVLEHDGRPWLVMQLVPCPSLREVVRMSGPLSPALAARVGLQILAAIRAAHNAGVLHRDVKPANVLLDPDDRVMLTDFGLAVADGSPRVTTTGLILGSPAYMSPECTRGEPATAASDLWSLGATLYAAVEGRDPFERNSTVAVLTAISTADPDAPSRAGLLWPVISGLLRKDPYIRLDAHEADLLLHRVSAAGLADTGPLNPTRQLSVLIPPAAAASEFPSPDGTAPDLGVADVSPHAPSGRTVLTSVLASVAAVLAVAFAFYLSSGIQPGQQAIPPPATRSASPTPAAHRATSVVSGPSASTTARPPKAPARPPAHSKKPGKPKHHGKHGNGNGNSQ
jgi:eukaryotic-like serine/threonine-protein kinase